MGIEILAILSGMAPRRAARMTARVQAWLWQGGWRAIALRLFANHETPSGGTGG